MLDFVIKRRNMKTKRKLVDNVTCDPIAIDMPKMEAKFVRFESCGDRFYVVYEIAKKDSGVL